MSTEKINLYERFPGKSDDEILQHRAELEVSQMGQDGVDEYQLEVNEYQQESFLREHYGKEMLNRIFQVMLKERKTDIRRLYLSEMDVSDETVDILCKLYWLKGLYLPLNNLTNSSVRKIAQQLPDLEELSLSGNKKINDISPLQNMTQLKVLWINETQVCLTQDDIRWIEMSKLENFDFRGIPIQGSQEIFLLERWEKKFQDFETKNKLPQSADISYQAWQTQNMNLNPNNIIQDKTGPGDQDRKKEKKSTGFSSPDKSSILNQSVDNNDQGFVIQDRVINLNETTSGNTHPRSQNLEDEELNNSRNLSNQEPLIFDPSPSNDNKVSATQDRVLNLPLISPERIEPRDWNAQDKELNNSRNLSNRASLLLNPRPNDNQFYPIQNIVLNGLERRYRNSQDEEQNNSRNQEEQVAFVHPNRNGDELGESNYQDDEQNNSENQEGQGAFVDSDPSQKNDYSKKFNSTLAVRNPQKKTQNATQSRCMNCLNFCNPF